MKATLPDGTVIEGTPSEIAEVLGLGVSAKRKAFELSPVAPKIVDPPHVPPPSVAPRDPSPTSLIPLGASSVPPEVLVREVLWGRADPKARRDLADVTLVPPST